MHISTHKQKGLLGYMEYIQHYCLVCSIRKMSYCRFFFLSKLKEIFLRGRERESVSEHTQASSFIDLLPEYWQPLGLDWQDAGRWILSAMNSVTQPSWLPSRVSGWGLSVGTLWDTPSSLASVTASQFIFSRMWDQWNFIYCAFSFIWFLPTSSCNIGWTINILFLLIRK